MDETSMVYLAMTALVPLVGLSFISTFPGAYGVLVALILFATIGMLMMLNWADFFVVPLVTSLLNVTFQPAKDYKITKSQDAVVKNINNMYYATGYLTANLFAFEFKTENVEMDLDEKIAGAPDKWERSIQGIDFPFKFHVLSCGRDVQKVRDEIEGKRGYYEWQMSRMMQGGKGAGDMAVQEMQRKINMMQTRIDRISGGEKPISTVMYVETTAIGITEKAAVDNLKAQINSLQISLSSLDLQIMKVAGREVYTLFNFNFALPTSFEELSTKFDTQG